MESVAAHKDEVAPVESKIDELKRKSVDSKETTDHESKNGNDEPVIKKIRKEAGDNASDDKAHSPDSRHAEAESEEDGTDGELNCLLVYITCLLIIFANLRLEYVL
ncbi:prothymosin alpha-B [Schistosoma japonicum]|nr:prothymosin alpha-B [Schistosoma japonicum]KAH8866696.1 prothymosin alpha-B [Schistosoma japonicum]KAH8866697.1 prothymosin alpha-B [Schistosoma japonicum]KAH8866698.1 prothymosin alpha-B [Schistosoma japonicum]KAH8866699.1 prothymosin alpha-B [Schistosoma japonicum]